MAVCYGYTGPDTEQGQVALPGIKGQLRAATKFEAVKEAGSGRLNSWKEIATFFDRDVRTVRRWEETRGLPVHRMPGGGRSGVYAYVAELERWMREAPAEVSTAVLTAGPEAEEVQEELELNGVRAEESGVNGVVSEPYPAGEAAVESYFDAQPVRRGTGQRWTRVAVGLAIAVGVAFAFYVSPRSGRSSLKAEVQEKPGKPSANAEAQELYLKGLYLWNQRTEQSLTDAVDLFTQAIVHDPHFAAAYAGLADSYLLLRQYGNMRDDEAFPRALAAVQQALVLDDSSPQAHRSYAFVLNYWMWDFAAAEKEFQRSFGLNNEDAQTHSWYATSLYSQGRYADAMREIDKARELQPDSITILANRGLLLASVDPPASIAYLQGLERINPTFANIPLYLSEVEVAQGKYDEFLDESRRAAELHKDTEEIKLIDEAKREWLAHGRQGMLQALAAGYGKRVDAGSTGAMVPAALYGRLGDQPDALRYLGIAYERRESAFLAISHDRAFASLQGNAEFKELVAKRNTPLTLADALRTAAGVSGKTTAAAAQGR